jgi:hypothetical protein
MSLFFLDHANKFVRHHIKVEKKFDTTRHRTP